MNSLMLDRKDVLHGYDAVSELYPNIPPLSHWRAWEYAAYQKFQINGRILDLGCGDGRYFRLIWPNATDVVGVDMEPSVAELGRRSGVYSKVHTVAAHQIPEPSESFDYIFANCSLEHMDKLDAVLAEIHRCLKPGGSLLCSVPTEHLIRWSLLPNLIKMTGYDDVASRLIADFVSYHHFVNLLSVTEWQSRFASAGLVYKEHIPILPKVNSGIYSLMDYVWHVRNIHGGELGDVMHSFFLTIPDFAVSFRKIFAGLLEMETDWSECSGAIFLAYRPRIGDG